jgi:hypothetical protein
MIIAIRNAGIQPFAPEGRMLTVTALLGPTRARRFLTVVATLTMKWVRLGA